MCSKAELSDAAQQWIISYLLYPFSAFCGCTVENFMCSTVLLWSAAVSPQMMTVTGIRYPPVIHPHFT